MIKFVAVVIDIIAVVSAVVFIKIISSIIITAVVAIHISF